MKIRINETKTEEIDFESLTEREKAIYYAGTNKGDTFWQIEMIIYSLISFALFLLLR